MYATVQELLVTPPASSTLDVDYQVTIMSGTDTVATAAANPATGTYVLVCEGAVPTGASGEYCEIAGTINGIGSSPVTYQRAVTYLGTHANCYAVIALGTCASFGGIPAAKPNPTTSKSVIGSNSGLRTKTINIPGCPPNPNWIVGTIAYILSNNLSLPSLDRLRRPVMYYGERICNNCDRFINNKDNFIGIGSDGSLTRVKLPDQIGSTRNAVNGYCLKKVGCKGSRTKSDCSLRKWHSPGYGQLGVNWCVGAGSPCLGCVQENFPDRFSPFFHIS
jgi:hydrogenase small subunit